MQHNEFAQPPGCAGWHSDEVRPTVDEASNPLFDLSDSANARKLARAISSRNTMDNAGWLVGELSYAYQNMTFDAAAIKECVRGTDDLQPVIDVLKPLSEKNVIAELLIGALEDALKEESQEKTDAA